MMYESMTAMPFSPGKNVLVKTVPCPECKSQETYLIPEKAFDDYDKGQFIQEAFSMLNREQRERLMTGICGTCWDKLIPADDED